jgi:hypothetical protein
MGAPALPYDRAVMQHVYLGAPLDVDTLPPFCTDRQQGCAPFRRMPTESDGIRGTASHEHPAPQRPGSQ